MGSRRVVYVAATIGMLCAALYSLLQVLRPPTERLLGIRRFEGIPYCDYSAGLLTDSLKNRGAGFDHRQKELATLVSTAVWSRRALVDFQPKFDPKHNGPLQWHSYFRRPGFQQWWWSDLLEMDKLEIHVQDTCGLRQESYHCRLRVEDRERTLNVVRLPRKRSRVSFFSREHDPDDTPPPCFQTTPRFQWSSVVEAAREEILDRIGPNGVILLLRMGDLSDEVPANCVSGLKRKELNSPNFILAALARHGILPPRNLYLTSNPGTTFDLEPFWQAGFSVALSPTLTGSSSNIFRFALERAVAESPSLWTVVTSKPPRKENGTIILSREPISP